MYIRLWTDDFFEVQNAYKLVQGHCKWICSLEDKRAIVIIFWHSSRLQEISTWNLAYAWQNTQHQTVKASSLGDTQYTTDTNFNGGDRANIRRRIFLCGFVWLSLTILPSNSIVTPPQSGSIALGEGEVVVIFPFETATHLFNVK